jgi:hypothetical protein
MFKDPHKHFVFSNKFFENFKKEAENYDFMLILKILLKMSKNIAHRKVIDKYLQNSGFFHYPYYSKSAYRRSLPARPPSS